LHHSANGSAADGRHRPQTFRNEGDPLRALNASQNAGAFREHARSQTGGQRSIGCKNSPESSQNFAGAPRGRVLSSGLPVRSLLFGQLVSVPLPEISRSTTANERPKRRVPIVRGAEANGVRSAPNAGVYGAGRVTSFRLNGRA
jgi:hypothetical protein